MKHHSQIDRVNFNPYYEYSPIPVNVSAFLPASRSVSAVEILIPLRSLYSSMLMSYTSITDVIYQKFIHEIIVENCNVYKP